MLIFRQLFDPQSSTYTYLLADSRHARSGADRPGVRARAARRGADRRAGREAARSRSRRTCTPTTSPAHRCSSGGSALEDRALRRTSGAEGADRSCSDGDRVAFGMRTLEARATPGHTSGCITYVLDDRSTRLHRRRAADPRLRPHRFPAGQRAALFRSVREQLFSLPDDCLLYPGHDYRGLTAPASARRRSTIRAWRRHIGEDDFVGYMTNLGLAHPKLMDVAVPANLRCGRPDKEDMTRGADTDWAPLAMHLRRHLGTAARLGRGKSRRSAQLIDVREPDEFDGALGHIAGAHLIPLGTCCAASTNVERKSRSSWSAAPARAPRRRPCCCQGGLRPGGQPRRRHAALERAAASRRGRWLHVKAEGGTKQSFTAKDAKPRRNRYSSTAKDAKAAKKNIHKNKGREDNAK